MKIKYIIPLLLVTILATGCAVKTVYVPHGQAVRLRQDVKRVKVWVKDKQGEAVPGVMDLPDGWYCLPLNKEK